MSTITPTTKPTLQELYYNPEIGLISAKRFHSKIKHYGYKLKDVNEFMKKQKTYQLNRKDTQQKLKYIPIKGVKIDEQWMIDLADMTKNKTQNRGLSWILLAVDVFSRYGFVEPLKRKSAPQVLNAFKNIIGRARNIPSSITHDSGKEFVNKDMKHFCEQNNIKQSYDVSESNKTRTSMVERLILTMRTMIRNYKTAIDTNNWSDVLQQLMNNYNSTKHETINIEPENVTNSMKTDIRPINTPDIGQFVRVKRTSKGFEKKSDAEKYSDQVYQIISRAGYSYKLKNIKSNEELKTMYRPYQMMIIENSHLNLDETPSRRQEEDKSNKKAAKIKKLRQREDIKEENIISTKRIRKKRVN